MYRKEHTWAELTFNGPERWERTVPTLEFEASPLWTAVGPMTGVVDYCLGRWKAESASLEQEKDTSFFNGDTWCSSRWISSKNLYSWDNFYCWANRAPVRLMERHKVNVEVERGSCSSRTPPVGSDILWKQRTELILADACLAWEIADLQQWERQNTLQISTLSFSPIIIDYVCITIESLG